LLNLRSGSVSSAFSAFRVSEWSVRRKVVAVLAIPVVLATVFGGLRVSSELSSASDYSATRQHATVLDPAVAYLAAAERLALPSALAKQMGDGHTTPAQQFDSASTALKRAAAFATLTPSQTALVAIITKSGTELRTGSGTGITATAPVQLSDIERATTDLVDSTLNTSGTPDPRVQALIQSLNGELSLAKQQLLIQSSDQQSSLLGSVWLAAEVGVEGSALENLRVSVRGNPRVAHLITVNGTRLGEATTSKVKDLAATPNNFATYDTLNAHLLDKIHELIGQRAADSKTRALTDTGIILGALLASLLLALMMARALINPLRKVRNGALDVANVQLPETVSRIRKGQEPAELMPIPVHSREELGQLARAVDDMHRQAVTLATGEAQLRTQVGAMFVTLSRRNTTLVNQQLALIESLEQDEEDPQRLEQLFSLDHLATRMRRTAESLVILGGTQGRTASFEELSVSDVIHAAVSEVQDYQRVRIDAAPERRISGRAASDVVHLLAELIDNALSYSPPGSPVTIQAAEENGRVEIEIIDTGLGMAGDALAQANESLKQGGEVTVDTARRMGLFVVSRLAEEHGLKVKLRRNPLGGGIVASIVLPTDVLASEQPVSHMSLMDAPQVTDAPAPVIEDEPDEDYDPYLERIEEAIAAVTGLPRRRPGLNVAAEQREEAPAAPVSMFEASPELAAAFEPMALPGHDDEVAPVDALDDVAPDETLDESTAEVAPDETEREPIALPASMDDVDDDDDDDDDYETLAEVVTPDFGAELVAEHDESTDDDAESDGVEDSELDTGEVAELDTGEVAELDTTDETDDEAATDDETEAEDEDEPWAAEPVAELSFDDDAEDAEDDEPAEHAVVASVTVLPDAAEVQPDIQPEIQPADVPLPPVAMAGAQEALAVGGPSTLATEAPVRLSIRRPLSAAPAAAALEGDLVPDQNEPPETPIFGQLRSNWLNDEPQRPWTDNEVERGWEAASEAESSDEESRTPTGLPVRRPGGRLVPGGLASEPAAIARDPEAIRNRLAAHSAGVSRGRAAAAAQPLTDDYAHEETGPA
jgi:signal transduction histidine kinase